MRMTGISRGIGLTFAAGLLPLGLAGCSQDANTSSEATAESSEPMAEALDDAGGMETLADALEETGLASVFEGAGSYTLLAPGDAVFDNLDESAAGLTSDQGKPAMAELLRDHILPGYVTRQDIERAIAAAPDGQARIRTMNDATLIFSQSDEVITVRNGEGAEATLTGKPIRSGDNIALPIDSILRVL